MKSSQFFAICFCAYIGPHASPAAAIFVGSYFGGCALYHAWREA